VPEGLRRTGFRVHVLLAPSAPTNSSTAVTSPVAAVMIDGFLPEKSTKTFSPARWT
jgi:hypothetical protein